MPRSTRPLRLAVALLALCGLAACAPANTGTTFSAASLGQQQAVQFGTIVGARPVAIAGSQSGVGAVTGAVAGGVAGSYIGGDWRARTLAGIGGAVLGGLAGSAVEGAATQGQAVEFFLRLDNGGEISVVQTNEQGLQVGDRVVLSIGDRTRISRAAGGPGPLPAGAGSPGGAFK